MSMLTGINGVSMDLAVPCCDGGGKCDGQSLLRLGASFTTGDLALISFSIPTDQLKRPPGDESESKSIRLWYVVVATVGEGEERTLTGILSGKALRVCQWQQPRERNSKDHSIRERDKISKLEKFT